MSRKYFYAAEAGCIGYTEYGYPIHDCRIVKTKVGKKERFFQVSDVYGQVNGVGSFEARRVETVRNVSSDDTVYDEPIFDGLEKRYAVTEITDFVKAFEKSGLTKSPYVSTEKFAEILSDKVYQLKDAEAIRALNAYIDG